MIRTAAIGPDHRANLRRLKAEFQAAYDAIEDPSDRSNPAYVDADRRYRIWIKAIDDVAMALLDDIESLEEAAKDGLSRPVDIAPRAAAASDVPDLADLFNGALESERTRKFVGTPDEDLEKDRLFDGL